MTDRVPCEGPGCHRTTGRAVYVRRFKCQPGTWICGTCWKRVPARLRRAKARHERERRKYGFYPREAAYERLWGAIWRHICRDHVTGAAQPDI